MIIDNGYTALILHTLHSFNLAGCVQSVMEDERQESQALSTLRLTGYIFQPSDQDLIDQDLNKHLFAACAGFFDTRFYRGNIKEDGYIVPANRKGFLQIQPVFTSLQGLKMWQVHVVLHYTGEDNKKPFIIEVDGEGKPTVISMKVTDKDMGLSPGASKMPLEEEEEEEEEDCFIYGHFVVHTDPVEAAIHENQMAIQALRPDVIHSSY